MRNPGCPRNCKRCVRAERPLNRKVWEGGAGTSREPGDLLGAVVFRRPGAPLERHFDDGAFDGAVSANGRISGCHVHGLFQSTAYRAALLESLGVRSSLSDHSAQVHAALDEIAATLEEALDIQALLRIGSLRST